MIYQLYRNGMTGNIDPVIIRLSDGASIPENPENTDYQNFKAQINDETAQLNDADGVPMTPEEAKAYVATLP